jgi:hypothetical protein
VEKRRAANWVDDQKPRSVVYTVSSSLKTILVVHWDTCGHVSRSRYARELTSEAMRGKSIVGCNHCRPPVDQIKSVVSEGNTHLQVSGHTVRGWRAH